MSKIIHTVDSYREAVLHRLSADDDVWAGAVKATYGEDYRYDALGLLFGMARFFLKGDDVHIQLKDAVLEIPRWRADMQLLAYQPQSSYFGHMERWNLLREGEDVMFDYSQLRVVPRTEGQAKLFLAFIESLPHLEVSNHTNVLCIGSSGDIGISGLSYEALVEILSAAGHSGTMYLYDPEYPQTHSYEYLSYTMNIIAEPYDYDNHAHKRDDITMIFEDVYVHNMSIGEPKPLTGVVKPVKKGRIPQGESIFVTYVDACGRDTMKAWPCKGKPSHSEHGLDTDPKSLTAVRRITGGGYIMRKRSDVFVSGSSLTYGPYDPQVLPTIMPNLNVSVVPVQHGRAAYDPGWTLLSAYPKARISTKYYGEPVPDKFSYRVSDQLMYAGHEKRLLYNVPQYRTGISSCCQAHARITGIAAALKVEGLKDAYTILDRAFSCVTRRYCSPFVGVSVVGVKQRLRAAAVQQMGMRDVIQAICTSLHVEPTMVHRVLTNMIRYKEIMVRRDTVQMFMTDFVTCKIHHTPEGKKCVFFSADGTCYYDPETGRKFMRNGDEVEVPKHKLAYLVRGSARVRTDEYGMHDVMSLLIKFNISWRSIMPMGIHGIGKHDVSINVAGAPIVILSRRGGRHIKLNSTYRKRGQSNKLELYVKAKFLKSRESEGKTKVRRKKNGQK